MIRPRPPDWMRSVRFRLAAIYSAALFAVGGALLGSLYLVISHTIDHVNKEELVFIGQPPHDDTGQGLEFRRTIVLSNGPAELQFHRQVNERALEKLRDFALVWLGGLAAMSLGLGWVIAGRVLRPIDDIGAVARGIQAQSLSRRIGLRGPDDELKRLADTFDAMLDRLERSFEAQRRFVADASHELRNPLAILRANLDLVLADPGSSKDALRERAGVLQRAIERMGRLVDDLLALARAESPSERSAPVDLARIAVETGEEFGVLAGAKGVSLDASVGPAPVVGDPEALRRAVANLVDNAVRVAPAGSKVSIAAGRENGWAFVSVADEGPGIGADDRTRVFERFARLDGSRSRADGGTGLGLAIVRGIAEAHGGEVALSSLPGRGATFTLRVPAEKP